MNRFYKILAIVYFVCAPPLIGLGIWDDFQHPERWATDPLHNPYLSLAFLSIVMVFAIAFGWRIWMDRRCNCPARLLVIALAFGFASSALADDLPLSYRHLSPEERKNERDAVLKQIPEAGPFTKKFGHLSVIALKQCSPEVGKRLIAVPWEKLRRPEALIEAAAKHGAPVCEFLARRYEELLPPGAEETYLKKPLECSWDLCGLEPEKPAPVAKPGVYQNLDWRIAGAVGGALVLGIGIGRKTIRRTMP